MSDATPRIVVNLSAALPTDPDAIFIVFASPERRCLGVAQRLAKYRVRQICLIEIEDEPNTQRAVNIVELRRLCRDVAPIETIRYRHEDPIFGVSTLAQTIQKVVEGMADAYVTVDISTFPRNALMLTLRAIERLPSRPHVRLLYTEAEGYEEAITEPLSFGLKRISVVQTFTAPYRPRADLLLVMFLGYERDRVLGIWQSIEPNRTIAVVPSPPYYAEWEGVTERLNASLLSGLSNESIYRVDPRNPIPTFDLLKDLLIKESTGNSNVYIAPLGTKPQAVGVYAFCRDYPDAATAIYTSPIEYNHTYISRGVGQVWELPMPGIRSFN